MESLLVSGHSTGGLLPVCGDVCVVRGVGAVVEATAVACHAWPFGSVPQLRDGACDGPADIESAFKIGRFYTVVKKPGRDGSNFRASREAL